MGLNLKLSSTIVHNQIKYRIRIEDLLWIRLRKKHVAPTGFASASLRDFLTVRTLVTQPMPMASQAAGRRIYYASITHLLATSPWRKLTITKVQRRAQSPMFHL